MATNATARPQTIKDKANAAQRMVLALTTCLVSFPEELTVIRMANGTEAGIGRFVIDYGLRIIRERNGRRNAKPLHVNVEPIAE